MKTLKDSKLKVSNQHDLDISEIQAAADHYVKIKKYSDRTGQLPSDLLGIQRKLISVFRTVGIRGKKKILIEGKQYGIIEFWYEGANLYFKEMSGLTT